MATTKTTATSTSRFAVVNGAPMLLQNRAACGSLVVGEVMSAAGRTAMRSERGLPCSVNGPIVDRGGPQRRQLSVTKAIPPALRARTREPGRMLTLSWRADEKSRSVRLTPASFVTIKEGSGVSPGGGDDECRQRTAAPDRGCIIAIVATTAATARSRIRAYGAAASAQRPRKTLKPALADAAASLQLGQLRARGRSGCRNRTLLRALCRDCLRRRCAHLLLERVCGNQPAGAGRRAFSACVGLDPALPLHITSSESPTRDWTAAGGVSKNCSAQYVAPDNPVFGFYLGWPI